MIRRVLAWLFPSSPAGLPVVPVDNAAPRGAEAAWHFASADGAVHHVDVDWPDDGA